MTGRRGLLLAVALAGIGGAVAALAGTQPWATGTARSAVTTTAVSISGGTAAPVATAAGLLGLAAVAALPATRRIGRPLIGLLLVVAGGAAASATLAFLTDPAHGEFRTVGLPDGGPTVAAAPAAVTVTMSAWPWLSVVAAVLLLGAGLLAVLTGRGWPVLGRRYDAPGGPSVARGPAAVWDELDAGRDPTATDAGPTATDARTSATDAGTSAPGPGTSGG